MDRRTLSNRHLIGKQGEDAAVNFYEKSGYTIIARNWHWSNKGEIDIVAYNKNNNVIVICEVKTRNKNTFVRACEAVNVAKQNKLRILANVFMQSNKIFLNSYVRFDVAEIMFDNEKLAVTEINMIENAF